jgi:hypothetical protein
MYSKSLFTNSSNLTRSVVNPLGLQSSGQIVFSHETLIALKAVQEFYTYNMSTRTYENIPTDYNKFLYLYNIIHTTYSNITNSSLRLLFKITEEGLVGAINSFDLNYLTNDLKVRNIELQKTIDDLIAGKNMTPALKTNIGTMSIHKTFTLAPLFSYYIMLYGMPQPGVGFDQVKLSNLLTVMERQCIDPYST